MNREERGIEIDLFQLVGRLFENLKIIVLVAVIFGILGYVGSAMFLTPIYESSGKMIVNTRKDQTQNVTNDQLNSAKNLIDTYAVIIRSRDVLNQVIDELSLTESYNQLANCVSVKAVNGTQIMQISVQHSNPSTALAITEKILEIVPSVIVETVEVGSVKPVEQAYASSEPVSPNKVKNAIVLAMLGLLASCVVVFVAFLMDNTYKSNADIQRELGLPVLGIIPAVESCKDGHKHGKTGKRRE